MITPNRPDTISPEAYAYMTKPPLSIRNDPQLAQEYQMFNEAIPVGLQNSLLRWAEQLYTYSIGGYRYVERDKLNTLERKLRGQLVQGDDLIHSEDFLSGLKRSEDLFLNAIEVAFRWAKEGHIGQLDGFLLEGGSTYRVGSDEYGNPELQLRQSSEMQKSVDLALSYEHRASEHLRRALSKCFGREPEPRVACLEAVSAVEAAAKPIITPNNSRATLSGVCKELRSNASKWETDSTLGSSVDTVRQMMELVWNRGHFRHGDETEPIEVPQAMAEMTVQTAVVLVTWFLSGRVRRRA